MGITVSHSTSTRVARQAASRKARLMPREVVVAIPSTMPVVVMVSTRPMTTLIFSGLKKLERIFAPLAEMKAAEKPIMTMAAYIMP